MEQLQSQLDTFRANLETFARLHRKDIQKDPVFRMHFQKMCGNIGVDPLACKVETLFFFFFCFSLWGGGSLVRYVQGRSATVAKLT